MGKVFKGGGILMEPPSTGWGILWFVDGYQAQVGGAKVVFKDGKEMLRFYLMPYENLAKRFNIDLKKDLDASGYMFKYYPKEMVICLNTYDPSRRAVFFSMLNWDGKISEATDFFIGKEQAEQIIKLRRQMRDLRAENERVKRDNFLARTNVQQYIKENMAESLTLFMPAIKSLITAEGSGSRGE